MGNLVVLITNPCRERIVAGVKQRHAHAVVAVVDGFVARNRQVLRAVCPIGRSGSIPAYDTEVLDPARSAYGAAGKAWMSTAVYGAVGRGVDGDIWLIQEAGNKDVAAKIVDYGGSWSG